MCRIAAYHGPTIELRAFLRTPPHSLYRQSWDARELSTATVNADGYGAAWLAADGRPAVYRDTRPIWADANLAGLERSLASRLWVANVRSATEGLDTHLFNTQPFIDDELIFTHNGFIADFAQTLRRRLRGALDEDIEARVAGNTDSEYLFALIRQQRLQSPDPGEALRAVHDRVRAWLEQSRTKTLLNILLTDGNGLHAIRSAVAADCPSLYFHEAHPDLQGGRIIASEPFDADPGWLAVPPHHALRLTPGRPAELTPL